MTPDEIERFEKGLAQLGKSQQEFQKEVREAIMGFAVKISSFEALIHTPGNCELRNRVRDLELQNARNKGIFVTIGFFVTAVSATIGGLIVKFWK